MLVERRSELLACARQLLLQVIRLESQVVPFRLEGRQQRGDGRQGRRAGANDAGRGDGQEVVGREGVAGVGLGAVLVDVGLDETLLVDNA